MSSLLEASASTTLCKKVGEFHVIGNVTDFSRVMLRRHPSSRDLELHRQGKVCMLSFSDFRRLVVNPQAIRQPTHVSALILHSIAKANVKKEQLLSRLVTYV